MTIAEATAALWALDRALAAGTVLAWAIEHAPDGDVDAAMQTAARVLAALAVPGVAELLAKIAARGRCDIPTATGTLTFTLEDADKATLRTLADAAKGTP